MRRPKLSHAAANLSMLDCISCSDPAFRAQWSAKRRYGSTSLLYLGDSLESLQVDQFPIGPVSQANSQGTVLKGV